MQRRRPLSCITRSATIISVWSTATTRDSCARHRPGGRPSGMVTASVRCGGGSPTVQAILPQSHSEPSQRERESDRVSVRCAPGQADALSRPATDRRTTMTAGGMAPGVQCTAATESGAGADYPSANVRSASRSPEGCMLGETERRRPGMRLVVNWSRATDGWMS